ncbi:MAG: ATP-binding protein [Phenylobacterium sp.]|nr:ATP-binding protein [Phenylobacterium sp.]
MAPNVHVTSLQLCLVAFRLPLPVHLLFNAMASLGAFLLGHPGAALALFVGASAFDAIQQHLVRRWQAAGPDLEESSGLRRLANLTIARITIYTAPSFAMAATGGLAEWAFYGLQLATLLSVAVGLSALSRLVFWSFVTPLGVGVLALCLIRFDLQTAGALMLSALILFIVVRSIATQSSTTINSWHGAYVSSVADRATADEGREAAREASLARANFLATMSHEIRTPMNGVMGMAQLLRRDERDPVQLQRLDILIDSGDYLLQILNDILDASKIDAGKLEIVTAPEDMKLVLERAVAFWTPRAEERGITLALALSGDPPGRLCVDALRLRQVLFNLMGNAIKFTESGSVTVEADAGPLPDGRTRLRLAVRDTGPGIPAQDLPALFDRFSQAGGPHARRADGAGLGLAIVYELTQLMGGRVWVESELGVGSVFHVELDLEVAEAQADPATAPGQDAERDDDASLAMTPLRVLAVDDNAINLMVLEQLLTSLGHTVAKAAGGEAALDALADETFDLVLTDIQMPAMTGSQLLTRIRATAGPNQAVPVIALTADVTSGGRQRYLDEGFTEHAAKPIQLQDLLESILRAVSEPADALAERVA